MYNTFNMPTFSIIILQRNMMHGINLIKLVAVFKLNNRLKHYVARKFFILLMF